MAKAVKPGSSEDASPLTNDEREIPIALNLPGLAMTFGVDWVLDTSDLCAAREKEIELLARVRALEDENASLRDKCQRISEESNLDKFKSQLLVEMLAVSSLDEERTKAEFAKEQSKVLRLRHDMKLLLEKATNENVDVRDLLRALAEP
ncbi:hypothetical protein SPRG_00362 [Saprolegnia parasitica CBS 223.65]|uniref:Uncharacterized protein n=1 Tax=Saprolegnia parasitica (strain CBS 223.65) TaxID=695850 RepID=A0A067D1Y7_SAPPC|nr:hypothetical protein SPRG_00362 [Saprolegnia parasitica CBS 223.65]KDO35515.1 hypothetical protein SPRG_00362 [Saprolegnia parasitica CBS 223.65]|eukprot:XP_012193851.1 hypothetical protein SPRG_00362 [Saprolegnia parasitica CBS 223.65]